MNTSSTLWISFLLLSLFPVITMSQTRINVANKTKKVVVEKLAKDQIFSKDYCSNKDPLIQLSVQRYCEAFNLLRVALKGDLSEVDVYCDSVAQLIQQVPKGAPFYDEWLCLKALNHVTRIRVDYYGRGLKYYLKAEECLDEALGLQPDNPTAFFLKGQNIRNLPSDFGGGMQPAEPYFQKCYDLFNDKEQDVVIWSYGQVKKILSKE